MDYEHWITSRRFWTDTLERVIRTAAHVALAVLGAPVALDAAGIPTDAFADWQAKALVIGLAALFALLNALAGRRVGDASTASLTSGTGGA